MLGFTELLVVASVAIVLFNLGRLGELAGSLGKSVRSFRKGVSGEEEPKPLRDVKEYQARLPTPQE